MVALSLKIGVGNVVKTMQFEPSTMVYDACRIIRERVTEAQLGQRKFPTSLRLPTHGHTLTHIHKGEVITENPRIVMTSLQLACRPINILRPNFINVKNVNCQCARM